MSTYRDNMDAARFVEGLLEHLKPGSVLTTTIRREKSGDYSVLTVTGELSDDTDEKTLTFYNELLPTSKGRILG